MVGPYKVIECGTGSVNIWAAGVWRGSELRHWTLSLPLMLSENKHSSRVFACCIRVEEVCLAARWATCNTLSSLMSHSAYWGSRMHHVCLICITLCSPTWNRNLWGDECGGELSCNSTWLEIRLGWARHGPSRFSLKKIVFIIMMMMNRFVWAKSTRTAISVGIIWLIIG